ncbi:MAG: molybdopterin molybdotransferase MoeA [Gammaproteobacteria bacterium]
MTASPIKKDPSCRDDYDPASLQPDAALGKIKQAISPVTGEESLPIRDALGRILTADIRSGINVPAAGNSAMDGYAINSGDLPTKDRRELQVIGTVFAGKPFTGRVPAGSCVRIMTGGLMPDATDTIIIQEDVQREGDSISIDGNTRPGDNVRAAGEDIAEGDLILARGRRLNPADLGLIASLGIPEVTVRRTIRVAFFSTGDELRSIGEPLEDGAIYDSNRYTLHAMLSRLGADIIDMGVIRDQQQAVETALLSAADKADVIITSGGVSVGEADFIKQALQKTGQVAFWKVAMKPGRPLAFGTVKQALFFGLPGNPVSVMVTFYQFVQPALRALMGETDDHNMTIKVRCDSKLKKRPGRVEYQRGIMSRDSNGELVVVKTGAQGSGILSSMSRANCFIILPLESTGIEAGSMVDVQPFFGLV